jgi:isoquinoline 1-oxidoreductase alpha subunit
MIQLTVNGVRYDLDVPPDMPLLWALRDVLGLTGTKYSCGASLCGACTVLSGDEPIRSCTEPVSAVEGASITTIEGLSPDSIDANDLDESDLDPVQRAWLEEDVPQCGYCQGGQILTAVSLLRRYADPTDAQIERAMSGVLCRCGSYHRVRRAVLRAAGRPARPQVHSGEARR